MRIKDIPQEERPKEKLMYAGAESLSTSELLALIIRTGNSSKSAVQLAEDVLAYSAKELGSLREADVQELTEIDGIGSTKACSIVASLELARRLLGRESDESRISMKNPESVANLLMEDMRGLRQEHLVALLLNAKCEIESRITVSIGELTSTVVHPREVFQEAVRWGAHAIMVAHNHPSGDPQPGKADIETTQTLLKASKLLSIPLLDHLVLGAVDAAGGKGYVSMRESGIVSFK